MGLKHSILKIYIYINKRQKRGEKRRKRKPTATSAWSSAALSPLTREHKSSLIAKSLQISYNSTHNQVPQLTAPAAYQSIKPHTAVLPWQGGYRGGKKTKKQTTIPILAAPKGRRRRRSQSQARLDLLRGRVGRTLSTSPGLPQPCSAPSAALKGCSLLN